MLAARSEGFTRRNGASAACEPCRVRKLACDHDKPVCARCIKRGKAELCTYHPAPMVGLKRRATRDDVVSEASPTRPPVKRRQQERSVVAQGVTEKHSGDCIASESPQNGYLGSTSFISSLTESRQELDRQAPSSEEAGVYPMGGLQGINRPVGLDDLETGACILRSFYPHSEFDYLVDETSRHCFGSYAPKAVLLCCWESLKEVLGPLEYSPHREQQLLDLSRLLFRNTATALALPGNQSQRSWSASFTGRNLRWESVGVVLGAAGSRIFRLRNAQKPDRVSGLGDCMQTAKWLAEASTRCLNFVDDLNQVNDMALWCQVDSLILTSQLYGDASYLTWKRLGDLSSAIFALGLHTSTSQAASSRTSIPRWLVEVREQLKYAAYHADLNLSMFMGRPPRLSSRYCSFESPPLELNRDELALEPDELERVVQSLSPRGERSPRDIILRPTRLRAAHAMVRQREKILELCLGSPGEGQDRAQVEKLVEKCQQLWNSRSKDFHYDPKIWSGLRPPLTSFMLLDMYLDHRYNGFLLQRVLVQRFHADPEQLLVIADDLLYNTLFLLGKECETDVDWTFSLYSLPAAGVLALELLKRQTQPGYRPPPRAPPRSRIVQNLSVLTAALKWISHEGMGNYSLSRQAMSTLERVLDRVLDSDCQPTQKTATASKRAPADAHAGTQPVSRHSQARQTVGEADGRGSKHGAVNGMAMPSDDFASSGGGGMDGLPWIGQMDFDESFWLGLEEHPLLDVRMPEPEFGGVGQPGYG